MIGLEPGIVRVVSYEEDWKTLFEQEKQLLDLAIGGYAEFIEHVGSTAVRGLDAKPIIDIAVALASIDLADRCVEPLRRLGYRYKGEYGIAGRHYFVKGNPRTHHLHMVESGGEFWENHLLFRNHLRDNPAVANEYRELKLMLAAKYQHDRDAYQEGKGEFIQRVLAEARSEFSMA